MKVILPLIIVLALFSIGMTKTNAVAASGCFSTQVLLPPTRGSVGNGSGLVAASGSDICLADRQPVQAGKSLQSDTLGAPAVVTVCIKSGQEMTFTIRASLDGKEFFDDTFFGSPEPAVVKVGIAGRCVSVAPAQYIEVVPLQTAPDVTVHLQVSYY